MRKVILQMYISLDGFVAGPNGEMDWIFSNVGNESESPAGRLLDSSDLILLGRKMSEEFLDYWPKDTTEFAAKINALPKIIFSRTMKESELKWNNVTIAENIQEEIKKEKAKSGKNLILYGGCGLVTSFAKLNLIDEYHLMIVPVILGVGLHLFEGAERINLKLIKSTGTTTGVVVLHYEPRG